MDENTKIIKDGFGAVAKQNREMNEQLKKLTKPTSLKESIQDNQGEILITAAMGALESKVDKQIAKSQNLGVGVMAKAGVDTIPGEEPVVDEKDTLFGIVKEFYGRFNFGNLIGLTKQNLKTNDKVLQGFQSLKKSTDKNNEDELTFFQRMTKFFTEEGEGFTGGFKQGLGIPRIGKTMRGLLESFKAFRKDFPMKAGLAVAKGIKLPFLFIGSSLKKLGSTLLKPLGSIVKGIAKLPGKILGFFGGAFSLIGRLALLGGGIFALSKLTDYLRGVGPDGKESFVDTLMFAFGKVKELFKFLGNIIEQTVIPMMIALGDAIFQTIAFLSKFIPGISLGTGEAAAAEKRIREKYKGPVEDPEMPPGVFLDEKEKEALIQKEIAMDKEKRFNQGLRDYLGRYYIGSDSLAKTLGLSTYQELVDEYRADFLLNEGKGLRVGDTMVTGPDSVLEKNLKEFKNELRLIEEMRTGGGIIGSGNNAVAIDAKQITTYGGDGGRILLVGDPHNIYQG